MDGSESDGKLHGRTLYLAWAGFAVLFVFVIIGGGAYWTLTRMNVVRCVYGDAVCSLTVGTYLLALVGCGAFLAAYRAARFAASALALERRPAIVVRRCQDAAHIPNADVQLFVRASDRSLTYVRTTEYEKEPSQFKGHYFEVMSVGRSPVVDATIPLTVRIDDGRGNPTIVAQVGSMRADSHRHVQICVPARFGDVGIQWTGPGAKHVPKIAGDEPKRTDEVPLECRVERELPGDFSYVVLFDATPAAGPAVKVKRRLPEKPARRKKGTDPQDPPTEPPAGS